MKLRVMSTGNAGVYLENQHGKIYIDSFFRAAPSVGTNPALRGAQAQPADIILITHAHYDHLHPEETRDAALAAKATVVGPAEAIDLLRKYLPESQLVTLEPPERQRPPATAAATVNNISITSYRTYHGRGHNSYLIQMGETRIFHDADNERTQHYRVPDLGVIDLLLLCPWAGGGAGEFVDKLKPGKWLLIHMTDEEIDQHRRGGFLPGLLSPTPEGVIALRGGEWLEI